MTFNDDLNYDLFGPPKQAVSGWISCPMWGGVPGIGMAQLGPGRRIGGGIEIGGLRLRTWRVLAATRYGFASFDLRRTSPLQSIRQHPGVPRLAPGWAMCLLCHVSDLYIGRFAFLRLES